MQMVGTTGASYGSCYYVLTECFYKREKEYLFCRSKIMMILESDTKDMTQRNKLVPIRLHYLYCFETLKNSTGIR